MSNSYKFYSDTKDIMKKYVNATEGAIIYGISKSRIMVLASEAGAVYSRYCVISCKIRKRYEEEFKKALAEMNNKMILRGYTDYADFCENFNTIIDKARCEL